MRFETAKDMHLPESRRGFGMAHTALVDAIRGLEFRAAPKELGLGVEFVRALVGERQCDFLCLWMSTLDRDSGESMPLWTLKGVPPYLHRSHKGDIRGWVMDAVKEFWLHELDEGIIFDCVRPRDPH